MNGILKGRFGSLRGIRRQVRNNSDLLWINNWIVCTLILHNVLIELNDTWAEEFQEEVQDTDDNFTSGSIDGIQFGESIKRQMLNY